MPDVPKQVTFSPLAIDGQEFPWYVHEDGVTFYPSRINSKGQLTDCGRLVLELIVDENTVLSARQVDADEAGA